MASTHDLIAERFQIDNSYPIYYSKTGTRVTLATLFAELGFNNGAEIGVFEGDYSTVLCAANPNLKLLCVDQWLPYADIVNEQQMLMHRNRARRVYRHLPGVTVRQMSSVDASRTVPNGSLDFVYIDAAHDFDNVMVDLIHWAPKVRSGGIVAGHDYTPSPGWGGGFGIIEAVTAYRLAHGIGSMYLTGELGHRRGTPSYFWIQL